MSATDVILIIGALSLAVVNVITALRVGAIQKSVNGAASVSVNEIAALRKEVLNLTAHIAEKKEIASLLAQTAASTKEGSQ